MKPAERSAVPRREPYGWPRPPWTPEERRILEECVQGVISGQFVTVRAAARACFDRIKLLPRDQQTAGAEHTLIAIYDRIRPRVQSRRFHGLCTFWTAKEDKIVKRYVYALLHHRYRTVAEAAAACAAEFKRVNQRRPPSALAAVPRNEQAIRSRLCRLARAAGLSRWRIRFSPDEIQTFDRYAQALTQGRYGGDIKQAVADCHAEIAGLNREGRPAASEPIRTLSAVFDQLSRRARRLGWSWSAWHWGRASPAVQGVESQLPRPGAERRSWSAGDERILDECVQGVISGQFHSIAAAARACLDRIKALRPGSSGPSWNMVYGAASCRVRAACPQRPRAYWSPEEDAIVERHAQALACNRYRNVPEAAAGCKREFDRLCARNSETTLAVVPRTQAGIRYRLYTCAMKAGRARSRFRFTPDELKVYEEHATALAEGRYAADFPRAVKDCHRALGRLIRKPGGSGRGTTRTRSSVRYRLHRVARRLGWSWHAQLWQSEEKRILDRYVRILTGPKPPLLRIAARRCWAELRALRRERRAGGQASPSRARTPQTLRTYLGRLATEAGHRVHRFWAEQEDSAIERYVQALLDGRYRDATKAARRCQRVLTGLRRRADGRLKERLAHSLPRDLSAISIRLRRRAGRSDRTWPGRRWTAAELKICRGWVPWYDRYRRVRRMKPLRTAGEGLQDDLAKTHHRRPYYGCCAKIQQEWRREHGLL